MLHHLVFNSGSSNKYMSLKSPLSLDLDADCTHHYLGRRSRICFSKS